MILLNCINSKINIIRSFILNQKRKYFKVKLKEERADDEDSIKLKIRQVLFLRKN
jgi:hypothetical protein